jgi:4-amino-4-deoxy-L-arabinose transferase-like glycosyltransferase
MRHKGLVNVGEFLILLAILALAFYIRLTNVATNPGWYTDEGTDIDIAHHLQMGEVQYLAVNQSFLLFGRPPLFQSVLATAFNVFGTGIETLRSLTGVLGVISVGLLFVVVRRSGERILALLAALMFAIYPNAVVYSRMGYSYNLLTPLVILTYWGMWEYINSSQRRWLVLAALVLGIGGLSNLASFNFILPLIVVILFRRRSDIFWVVPLIFLPFILYALFMLLTASQAFLFDVQFTLLRIGKFSFLEQISLTFVNFISLIQHDFWVGLGIVGLFIIPIERLYHLSILSLVFPLLALGRTVILGSAGYYYFIPLMPFIALGVAALVNYGTPYVFEFVHMGLKRLFAALNLPQSPISRWFQTRLIAIGTASFIFYLFIAPLVAITFFHIASYIPTRFPTMIDSYLLNPSHAQGAIDYVNRAIQQDDVVIASPGLAWAINGDVADFQMSIAYQGIATEHLPNNIPSDRWVFDPTYTRARFVIIDNLWLNWAVNEMDEVRTMVEDVTLRWQLAFEAGAIKVYENPFHNVP